MKSPLLGSVDIVCGTGLDPRPTYWDYRTDFNEMWKLASLRAGHHIVVWAETPDDPRSRPVVTTPHVTPFDWALAARSVLADFTAVIVDVRRHQGEAPALRWLRSQRRECVSWLKHVDTDALTTGVLKELLQREPKPREELVTTPDEARGALRTLPVCRYDLEAKADHHGIANLLGPLFISRRDAEAEVPVDHRMALRQLLLASGVLGTARPPRASSKQSEDLRAALRDRTRKLRLVLLDDQWQHGWLDWLCERVGARLLASEVEAARTTRDGGPLKVAEDGSLSVWVAESPTWLAKQLRTAAEEVGAVGGDKARRQALERCLQLTPRKATEAADEIAELLLLDIRLFAGSGGEEQSDELAVRLSQLHHTLLSGGDAEAPNVEPGKRGSPRQLTWLARTIAVADPLLPVVIFSSTGRRDVMEALADYPSVVTKFVKPRLLGGALDDMRERVERSFDAALEQALEVVQQRQLVRGLLEAKKRAEAARKNLAPATIGCVGIYLDESLSDDDSVFIVAGVVALAPSEQALVAFEASLGTKAWAKIRMEGTAWQPAVDKLSRRAERVLNEASKHGVKLRAVVLREGKPLPKLGHYGPRGAPWADTVLDRVHRLLFRECIAMAMAFGVEREELTDAPVLRVVTDVRVRAEADLKPHLDEAKKMIASFGLERFTHHGAPTWSLLDTASIYPLVEEILIADPLLPPFQVTEARACRGEASGHRLVEWADDIAYLSMHSRRHADHKLPDWVEKLLESPGFWCDYDEPMMRLVAATRSSPLRDPTFNLDAVGSRARARGIRDRCLERILRVFEAQHELHHRHLLELAAHDAIQPAPEPDERPPPEPVVRPRPRPQAPVPVIAETWSFRGHKNQAGWVGADLIAQGFPAFSIVPESKLMQLVRFAAPLTETQQRALQEKHWTRRDEPAVTAQPGD